MDTTKLPTDSLLLQQMLLEQQAVNQRLLEQISQLTFTLEKLQKLLFGGKSEKRSDSKKAENKKANPAIHPSTSEKDTSHLNGRRRLPDDLPRVRIEHDLPADQQHCAVCHCPLHRNSTCAINTDAGIARALFSPPTCQPNRLIKVWQVVVY